MQQVESGAPRVVTSVAEMRSRIKDRKPDPPVAPAATTASSVEADTAPGPSSGAAASSSSSTTTATTTSSSSKRSHHHQDKEKEEDVFTRLHRSSHHDDKYTVVPGSAPQAGSAADLDGALGPNGEPAEVCVAEIKAYDIVLGMCRARDPVRLFAASADKSVKLWDIRSLQRVGEFSGHERRVSCITSTVGSGGGGAGASGLSGDLVFSGSSDRTVRVWSASDGQHIATLDAGSQVHSIAYAAGKVLAGLEDGTVRAWDAASGWKSAGIMRAGLSGGSVLALHASAPVMTDGECPSQLVFSGSRDGSILAYDAVTLDLVHRFVDKHYSGVTAFETYTERGAEVLVSSSRDKSVRVFDINNSLQDTRRFAQRCYDKRAHREGVNAMAVYRDVLFTASSDKNIARFSLNNVTDAKCKRGNSLADRWVVVLIWWGGVLVFFFVLAFLVCASILQTHSKHLQPQRNSVTHRRLATLVGHAASVESLCVVQDVLVSGGIDRTLRCWKVR
jgi:WD40 repeat protein